LEEAIVAEVLAALDDGSIFQEAARRAGGRIERAAADGAPEQLKQPLDAVVEQIQVESRACNQPYFIAPTVRTRPDSRRRTGIEPA
jgi:hypothetical protein